MGGIAGGTGKNRAGILILVVLVSILFVNFPVPAGEQILKDIDQPDTHPQHGAQLPIEERHDKQKGQQYRSKNFSFHERKICSDNGKLGITCRNGRQLLLEPKLLISISVLSFSLPFLLLENEYRNFTVTEGYRGAEHILGVRSWKISFRVV
jgi:hypothetical protein